MLSSAIGPYCQFTEFNHILDKSWILVAGGGMVLWAHICPMILLDVIYSQHACFIWYQEMCRWDIASSIIWWFHVPFFLYLHILRSFPTFCFHMIPQMDLSFSCPSSCPFPSVWSFFHSFILLFVFYSFSINPSYAFSMFTYHRYRYIIPLFLFSSKYFLIPPIIAQVPDRFLESNIAEIWNIEEMFQESF